VREDLIKNLWREKPQIFAAEWLLTEEVASGCCIKDSVPAVCISANYHRGR
jgi:hypothetical protein